MRAPASLQMDSMRGLAAPIVSLSPALDEEERGKSPFASLSAAPFLLQELFRSLPEKQSASRGSSPQCEGGPLPLDRSPLSCPQSECSCFRSSVCHETQRSQASSSSIQLPTLLYRSPGSPTSQRLVLPEVYEKNGNYSGSVQPRTRNCSGSHVPCDSLMEQLHQKKHMKTEGIDASRYTKGTALGLVKNQFNNDSFAVNGFAKGSKDTVIDYFAFNADVENQTVSNRCGHPSLASVAPSAQCRVSPNIGERYMNDRQRNPCKVFVGGIGQGTVESTIREYFKRFGEVVECGLVTHKKSGKSRGFGFVTYATPDAALRAIQAKHKIDDVLVECREALPREEARSAAPEDLIHVPTKVFVGGIPDRIHEEELREFFSRFGSVLDVSLAYDKTTHRPRGFGFVVFSTIHEATRAVGEHALGGKIVEVKHAIPRSLAATGRQRSSRGSPSVYPANVVGNEFSLYNNSSTSNTDRVTPGSCLSVFGEHSNVPLRMQQAGSNTLSYQSLGNRQRIQHYPDQTTQEEQGPDLNIKEKMASNEVVVRRTMELDKAQESSAILSSILTTMSLRSQYQNSPGSCEAHSSMYGGSSSTLPSPFELISRKLTPRTDGPEVVDELASRGTSKSLFSHSHIAPNERAEGQWRIGFRTPSLRAHEFQNVGTTSDDCASTDCSSHSECDTSYFPTISPAPAVYPEEKTAFPSAIIPKTDFYLTPPSLFERCSKVVDSPFASQSVNAWLGLEGKPSALLDRSLDSPLRPGGKRRACDLGNSFPGSTQNFQARVWTNSPCGNGSAMVAQTEHVAVASAANVLRTSSPLSSWARLNDAEQQRLQCLLGFQAGLEKEHEVDYFSDDSSWRLKRGSPEPYLFQSKTSAPTAHFGSRVPASLLHNMLAAVPHVHSSQKF